MVFTYIGCTSPGWAARKESAAGSSSTYGSYCSRAEAAEGQHRTEVLGIVAAGIQWVAAELDDWDMLRSVFRPGPGLLDRRSAPPLEPPPFGALLRPYVALPPPSCAASTLFGSP
jgi:hypothetical protein